MIYSRLTFVGDGVNNQYPLSFPLGFLRKKFLTCRVGEETDSVGNPVYREIEFISTGGNLVRVLGPVPKLGETVVFKRTMPKDTLLHVYHRGSPLTETALDESNQQLMMAIHEVFDTYEDMTEWIQKLIENVGHITNINIAVTDAPYGEKASGEFNQDTGMLTLKVPAGPKGERGDPGDRGPQGIQGRDGVAGKDGRDGAPGKDGAQGPQGISGVCVTTSGLFAFEIQDGDLILKYNDGAIPPDMYINDNGELIWRT